MNKLGLKQTTEKTAEPLVEEQIKSCLLWLEENGFKFTEKSEWNSSFIYRYEKTEIWYGNYSCEIMFNTREIECIHEHFSGAATGIEGWLQDSFNGKINNKQDFMTVLKLTGVEKRLNEWNEK